MSIEKTETQAALIVSKYAEKRTRKAFTKVEKERCRDGCGCIRCAHSSVDEANYWTDWHSTLNPGLREKIGNLRYKVELMENGMWKIVFINE